MKGGQLVRGVTMCQTEGFHQFLSPEYWILYKLFAYKIGGGGGGPQAPQDSTPTWDHELHPYVDVFLYQGSNMSQNHQTWEESPSGSSYYHFSLTSPL